MESDIREGDHDAAGTPDAAEARAALETLDADAARLAEQVPAPWWHHFLLGAMVALGIGALALPSVVSGVVFGLVVVHLFLHLPGYARRRGLSTAQLARPRSRRTLVLVIAVPASLLIVSALLRTSALPTWWIALPALAGLLAMVPLGRHYDTVLKDELRTQATRR